MEENEDLYVVCISAVTILTVNSVVGGVRASNRPTGFPGEQTFKAG